MISNPQARFRLIAGTLILGVAAVLLAVYPPFRIVDVESAKRQRESKVFNAAEAVNTYWTATLGPSIDANATDAAELLALAQRSATEANERFARRAGMGSTFYYFVRGTGRIVSVTPDSIGIGLAPDAKTADVIIPLGRVFGNAARDGLGAFKVDDYPSSQEFNKLSGELNKRVENDILTPLRANAKVGQTIEFAGSAEFTDDKTPVKPLRIVPVRANIR